MFEPNDVDFHIKKPTLENLYLWCCVLSNEK